MIRFPMWWCAPEMPLPIGGMWIPTVNSLLGSLSFEMVSSQWQDLSLKGKVFCSSSYPGGGWSRWLSSWYIDHGLEVDWHDITWRLPWRMSCISGACCYRNKLLRAPWVIKGMLRNKISGFPFISQEAHPGHKKILDIFISQNKKDLQMLFRNSWINQWWTNHNNTMPITGWVFVWKIIKPVRL